MRKWVEICTATSVLMALLAGAPPALAATIDVPAGGNLQAALNAALPGDTILLAPAATYTGNFVLPVHAGGSYITIRSAAADSLLPPANQRISPAYSPYLPRIASPNASPAIRTAAGASYWRLQFLELLPTSKGTYDILALGDGSSAQNSPGQMPHHLIVDRVYIHGDPVYGQKRAIALNAGETTIVNSHIADIKAAGQDSQAIAGWNGAGPYTVENNYLEAAGNVVLIGGDDPKIANLTPANLLFRFNTMSRPVAWRNPIVPTPDGFGAAAASGGALPAGTYAYRVAARQDLGSSGTGTSVPAAEVSVTVGAGGAVALAWNAVANAKDYVVYGRALGAQSVYWVTTNTAFTDTGGAGTAGTPPSKGTVWTVKNIFELKNARQVQVDYNLMENNWAQAQTGVAILLTPRNQYGGCTWCVVEDITIEYNVVRHTGAGITVTGWDNENPSQQTNAVRIRHNEFFDYSKFWGGSGYFALLDNQPRDVTIDHNTLVSGQGAGMMVLSGPAMSGIVVTNNVVKHDSYGIFGTGMGSGNAAINYYLIDGVVTRNALAGGRASDYPAGNLFPTVTDFQNHFVDYAGGDFALVPGTDWANAGTDALDLGADIAAIRGSGGGTPSDPPSILTTTLGDGVAGEFYSAALEGTAGTAPYLWAVYAGALPQGLQLDAITGVVSGAPLSAGDSTFTIELTDAAGLTARQPLSLHVTEPVDPVSITTAALPAATVETSYSTALSASGGNGSYAWSLVGGTLPPGLGLSVAGVISGTPVSSGNYSVSVEVVDAGDPDLNDSRTFALQVILPASEPPAVSLSAPAGSVPLASTVTLTASASDSDGSIERVDFYVDGTLSGTDAAAPYTFEWLATAGEHRFVAVALDDAGASAQSAGVTITPRVEVVLYAKDVKTMAGAYVLTGDATAAGGVGLRNPDAGARPPVKASPSPGSYAEFEFYAEAGRSYHLWIRGRAQSNLTTNDSVFVQFSGVNTARIGTNRSLDWELEDGSSSGVSNWGWQDDGVWKKPGAFGTSIVFERSGLQTLRIQPREDGLTIDQIVLSPDQYLLVSPGALQNDATIVPK